MEKINNKKLTEVIALLDTAINDLKGLKRKKVDRFVLDERVGIAAIIDTQHENYNAENPGLHPLDPWVLIYIDGQRINNSWELCPIELRMLRSFTDTLNIIV